MKKLNCILCFFISVILIGMTNCSNLNSNSLSENQKKLDNYNVIWNSPSKDHHGSMPLGNGDIGLNVWVEESGDICFYIGKTDSWGDNGRLLKVGKVRVKSEPSIVFTDTKFNQELDLKTGSIKISSHGKIDNKEVDFNLQIWVDANNPVIHLTHDCSVPVAMTANIELWRIEPYSLPSLEVSDLLEDRSKPGNLPEPVIVEPDNLISGKEKYIGWFHHNKKSVGFDFNMKLQGLADYPINDPILHRTFGAIITATDAEKLNDTSIKSKTSKSGSLNIYVLTQHPSQPNEWQEQIELVATDVEAKSFNDRKKDHENWWSDFWDRSWIYADASDNNSTQAEEAYAVTRAYTLQRFIDALAGRGNFPIKFNGSLFTVPAEDKPGDADYRR